MKKQFWTKNGKFVTGNGKLLLCEHCPCDPCIWTISCDGWDHGHTPGKVTKHIFAFTLSNCVIAGKDLKFDFDPMEVDLDATAAVVNENTIRVDLKNDGSGEDDSFGFSVTLKIYPAGKPEFQVQHAFSGGATSSDFQITDSLNCNHTAEEEEFE